MCPSIPCSRTKYYQKTFKIRNGWWQIYYKNATWRWQWAHLKTCIDEMHYLILYGIVTPIYFLRYELFSSLIFGLVQTDRRTDRRTDRKRCIWAHRANCTGGLKKLSLSNADGSYSRCNTIRHPLYCKLLS